MIQNYGIECGDETSTRMDIFSLVSMLVAEVS